MLAYKSRLGQGFLWWQWHFKSTLSLLLFDFLSCYVIHFTAFPGTCQVLFKLFFRLFFLDPTPTFLSYYAFYSTTYRPPCQVLFETFLKLFLLWLAVTSCCYVIHSTAFPGTCQALFETFFLLLSFLFVLSMRYIIHQLKPLSTLFFKIF